MSAEFFSVARYKMALPADVPGVEGGIIFPSGIASHTLRRRELDSQYPHLRRRLLDPQLYLQGLNPATARKTCGRLATYPWFPISGLEPYNSSKQRQSDWARSAEAVIPQLWDSRVPSNQDVMARLIRSSLQFQSAAGCEALVLPSPLTVDPATDYSTELKWCDLGLSLAHEVAPDKAALVTIALSDTALRSFDPWRSAFLDLLLDQLTARVPAGAYIVLESANEQGYYITHPNTLGALLRLVHVLKSCGVGRIVVANVGIAGLVALGAGADTWSTGWYRGERRLKLADFEDSTGRAYPTYYSHQLASECNLETDLDKITGRGFLSSLSDITEASTSLLRALAAGNPASSVPEWTHRPSNVRACQEHFLRVALRETLVLSPLAANERRGRVLTWLRAADDLSRKLFQVGSFNPRTELDHQAAWRTAFERYLEATG